MFAELRLLVGMDEAEEEKIYLELIRFFLDREGCPEVRCSYNHLNERMEVVAKISDAPSTRSYEMDLQYIRDATMNAVETCRMLMEKDHEG